LPETLNEDKVRPIATEQEHANFIAILGMRRRERTKP